MKWRSLPPLSALRAFTAFAQTRNIVAAGDALGVSHAAISQQLRVLEEHMEVSLLDRKGRSMALTLEGEKLSQTLQRNFSEMIETVEELTGQQATRPLHISVTPSFAAFWLMPRLPKFRAAYPDVDLMIDPSAQVVPIGPGGIDLAIRYGTPPWPGVEAEMVLQSPIVVVAAPALVGDAPIKDVGALVKYPWFEEFGTTEATGRMQRFGIAEAQMRKIQVPGNLMLDGVRDGVAIGVIVRAFVERDIAAGRLRELDCEEKPNTGYHIVTRPGAMRHAVKAFTTWLRREAREPVLGINPDRS